MSKFATVDELEKVFKEERYKLNGMVRRGEVYVYGNYHTTIGLNPYLSTTEEIETALNQTQLEFILSCKTVSRLEVELAEARKNSQQMLLEQHKMVEIKNVHDLFKVEKAKNPDYPYEPIQALFAKEENPYYKLWWEEYNKAVDPELCGIIEDEEIKDGE